VGSGDCRRRLGGLGEWVKDWQRSTPWPSAAQAGHRSAPSVVEHAGEQIKYGCQEAIVLPAAWRHASASTPQAKSLPMAVAAASASVACAWADTPF
jgi:hypothetical protein